MAKRSEAIELDPADGNISTGSSPASLEFLVGEAERVAREMAALREDRVNRLCGPSAPSRNADSAGALRTDSPSSGGAAFSPFYYYPFLFAPAFPSIRAEDLHTLALANRVLLEAILLADRKIDETRPWGPADFCLEDSYFHKALEMLIPLFPLEHTFWHRTQAWFLQHARAVVKEQLRHRHRLCRYSREEFFDISTGKVALLKTTLLAMRFLSGRAEPLAPLMESQDRFLAGFQCFDDLRDWKEDLRHGNFTFLLTRALFAGQLHPHAASDGRVPLHEVGRVLYHRGIAEDQLRMAEQYFREALASVQRFHVPRWTETVHGFLRHCRTMRLDLVEILRRNTCKALSRTFEARIEGALSFLQRASRASGGFPLARSPCPYMRPSASPAPSRFVTFCVLAALSPLHNLDPRVSRLLLGAQQWLFLSGARPPDPSLPAALEESFVPIVGNRHELLEIDRKMGASPVLRPHGLFWAHLHYTASRAKIPLTRLRTLIWDSVLRADYLSWTRTPPSEPPGEPPTREACHPLLPLLLFCLACGPDLPRRPLYEHVLRRNRAAGPWNNPTETALSLLCLMSTGYHGPELSSGLDKIVRSQEKDGSWPPNAVYEQEDLFYGSREMTTAWCLLALFLHHLGPGFAENRQKRTLHRSSNRPASMTRVVINPGLHSGLSDCASSALTELRKVLPPPWPRAVYLGTWPGMPPHFLLNTEQGTLAGVNLFPLRHNRTRSAGCRPLDVEIFMAVVSAHRCLRTGPLRDRLERMFVNGLALSVCARLLPLHSAWERLGIPKLDWTWCREHEAFLWEELRRFLLHPRPGDAVFQWLLPDRPGSCGSPIPKGASLFLGESLFQEALRDRESSLPVHDLLGRSLPDIVRTFRRKAGLDRNENFFA